MRVLFALLCLGVLLSLVSGQSSSTRPAGVSPNAVKITFLHINDLYELMPTGKNLGGVSRVATLRTRLAYDNANTYTVLGGDLYSPSALSGVSINATYGALSGRQMVAAMNALQLDFMTYGNHETDVRNSGVNQDFTRRMNESNFLYICANALVSYPGKLVKSYMLSPRVQPNGTAPIKIGIVGATIDSNNRTGSQVWANLPNAIEMVRTEVASLKAQGAQAIIALTHLNYWDDQALGAAIPDIDIIMGGHEHIMIKIDDGKSTPVFKADSNVHSAWIHDLWIDPSLNRSTNPSAYGRVSTFVPINASLPMDPAVEAVSQYWIKMGFDAYATLGFYPNKTLAYVTETIDALRSSIAYKPTLATTLFSEALYNRNLAYVTSRNLSSRVDFTIFNIGGLRLDDVIDAGSYITQYDALRLFPFPNAIQAANVSGTLVEMIINAHLSWIGQSNFLAWSNVTWATSTNNTAFDIAINGKPLDRNAWYIMGSYDYLFTGPTPYPFLLQSRNPNLIQTFAAEPNSDIRFGFISMLGSRYPLPVSSSTGAAGASSSSGGNSGGTGAASTVAPTVFAFVACQLFALLFARFQA